MPERCDVWRRYSAVEFSLRDLHLGCSLGGLAGKTQPKKNLTRVQVSHPEEFMREPLR